MASSLVVYLLGLVTVPLLRLLLTRFLDCATRSEIGGGFYSDQRDTFALNVVAPQHGWFNMGYWVGGPKETFAEACEALCRLVVEVAVKDRNRSRTTRVFEAGCGAGDSTQVWGRTFDGMDYVGATLEEGQYKSACQRAANLANARVVHGDAVKVIQGCDEGTFDVIVAVNCVFHFRSRDDFLRSSYRTLSTQGHLCMTDLLLPSHPLSMQNRFLLRLLCIAASLPFSNLKTPTQYHNKLVEQGFKRH
ncbi:BQ2448_7110 [Microbotryum intermedium]|uniref:BQ2448_7110 protein n=1 Tax=Microbotryum intermedium TaxID=269621 RepID=A0A238FJ54_9BASI|nr:BQ2448_7110 [Microbotryum intermedium]